MDWRAGAKGATFANMEDPDASLTLWVADLNPAGQGRFIPGTGHRVFAPAGETRLPVKCVAGEMRLAGPRITFP